MLSSEGVLAGAEAGKGCDGLVWLLPEKIGGIRVAAASGVIEFQVGVPVECVFDEVETRVEGVVVEPMLLKPGLHNVLLHFYDLYRNSIVLSELRLTGAGRTHVIPFHVTVTQLKEEGFAHTQVFTEEEKQAWGVKGETAGKTVWTGLGQEFMARLADFERRTLQRPCSLTELEAVEQELDRRLALLRRRREELRARNSFLEDPLGMGGGIHRVRAALRRLHAQHKSAASSVRTLRELVQRGHIRRAVAGASELRKTIAEFSDLSLDFVSTAEIQYRQRRRRLTTVGILVGAGIILAAIIIKVLSRTTVTIP